MTFRGRKTQKQELNVTCVKDWDTDSWQTGVIVICMAQDLCLTIFPQTMLCRKHTHTHTRTHPHTHTQIRHAKCWQTNKTDPPKKGGGGTGSKGKELYG